MSPLDARNAHGVIEARLARRPQDMLEAAVVLEAWGGLPAQAALEAARGVMRSLPAEPETSVGRLPRPAPQEGTLAAAVAFVVTTLAIAGWAGPLTDALGASAVERALMIALPLTLALQWALQSAYVGRAGGLQRLGSRPLDLAAGICLIVTLPAALLGLAGFVAGLLTLTWVGGMLLMRRGWGLAYTAYILLGTVEMQAGLPALPVLACMSGAAVAAAAMAVRGRAPVGAWTARGGRAAAAAAIGAGLGLMIVADASVSWSEGAAPALALLPSVVGGLWGGHHLRRLGDAIPRAVAGVPVSEADARGLAGPPVRLLAGALARLALGTTAISAALLLFTPWLGAPAEAAGALAGFGLLAVAMLLVSLLESLGRARLSLAAIAAAVALEVVVSAQDSAPFAGAGLLAAAALVVIVLLPAVLALLRRPGRTLATSLWIA